MRNCIEKKLTQLYIRYYFLFKIRHIPTIHICIIFLTIELKDMK